MKKELVFLCCILSVCVMTVSSRGDLSRNSKCPLWFYYVPSTNSCQCLPYQTLISCDGKKAVFKGGYILTAQQNKTVSLSYPKTFRYITKLNWTQPGYHVLPDNISDLNDFMCRPLNRKGYLCSDCIDGFAPSVSMLQHPNQCYRCPNKWQGVIINLVTLFLPVTFFYLIMLVFQIRMTSAPMPCFIMYSQLIVHVTSHTWSGSFAGIGPLMLTETGELRTVTRVIFVVYGMFDLDFFSHALPPFCVSRHFKLYHRTILGYITAFYPILLIVITWICIKLHDRNFRVIVYLWRPFHRCFIRLRRGWDTTNDLIDVFATFFLLSYVKILIQFAHIVSLTKIFTYSLNGDYSYFNYTSNIDNTISISSVKYITGSLFAMLVSFIFNFLPLLLLVLYPFGKFRRILSKLHLDRLALMIFVERFHCCYKNGLDGRRDMRYFSGIYFFLVIALSIAPPIFYYTLSFDKWLIRGTIFLVTALLIALCQPYKITYMNVCDTLLLSHFAMICFMLLSGRAVKYFDTFIHIFILIPFVILVVVICFKCMLKVCNSFFIKSLGQCQLSRLAACQNADRNDSSCPPREPRMISVHSYGSI